MNNNSKQTSVPGIIALIVLLAFCIFWGYIIASQQDNRDTAVKTLSGTVDSISKKVDSLSKDSQELYQRTSDMQYKIDNTQNVSAKRYDLSISLCSFEGKMTKVIRNIYVYDVLAINPKLIGDIDSSFNGTEYDRSYIDTQITGSEGYKIPGVQAGEYACKLSVMAIK